MTVIMTLTGDQDGTPLLFPLAHGLNPIGSDPSNRVVLEEHGVSRFHALLIVEGQSVQVVDQNSKNGTFVNGERVRHAAADLGDEIWIGGVELKLVATDLSDVELAFEIPQEPATVSPASTRDLRPSGDATAAAWSHLIASFAESLSGPSRGTAALDVLCAQLNATSACLLELSEHDQMVVVMASGVSPSVALEGVRTKLLRGSEDEFTSDPTRTWLVQPAFRLALMVTADFSKRQAVRPLLEALLRVYRAQQPTGVSTPRRTRTEADLIFPEGYVRGTAPATVDLYRQMASVAASDLPLLVCGETGVGKEMIARALHASSPRREKPFVAINCAAVPADLLEAELFGIDARVATGVDARSGRFREAAGGTVFLDEIGEMPASLQAKLLRVLQEREIAPLGGWPVAIDFRLLAATNAEISELIDAGHFRRDLFFRLAGSVLEIAPLRQRRQDIPALIESFLRDFSFQHDRPIRGITVAAQDLLLGYDWPGNVRELEHEIRRLAHRCPAGQAVSSSLVADHIRHIGVEPGVDLAVESESMPESQPEPLPEPLTSSSLPTLELEALESLAIHEALRVSDGNKAEAARRLGISRWTLLRRLKRLEL